MIPEVLSLYIGENLHNVCKSLHENDLKKRSKVTQFLHPKCLFRFSFSEFYTIQIPKSHGIVMGLVKSSVLPSALHSRMAFPFEIAQKSQCKFSELLN